MELLFSGGVWGDPEHAGEDAAGGLFGAGLVVAVVGAGFGGDAGGVFGGEVDFAPPVVLVAVGFGDEAEVGFDPFGLAVGAEVAAPAGGFWLDVADGDWAVAGGFFDGDACFGDGEGVGEEVHGWFVPASSGWGAAVGVVAADEAVAGFGQVPDSGPRAGAHAADASGEGADEVKRGQVFCQAAGLA